MKNWLPDTRIAGYGEFRFKRLPGGAKKKSL
jgi:hypothetical protein